MGLYPPCARVEDIPKHTTHSPGLRWFWVYALQYVDDHGSIMRAHTEQGSPFDMNNLDRDVWFDMITEDLTNLGDALTINILETHRNQYNCPCASVEIKVRDAGWISHLVVGLTLSLVYGPEPTWDVL